MKLRFYFSIFFLLPFVLFSQSSFRKLSRPEKCWVLFHPLKANKAQAVTKQVQMEVDSIKKTGIIGADNFGGQLDAFKHAYWMASLSLAIGRKQSLKLGKAHEKGNYLQFKKHLLEDAFLPDSVSSVMDLKNNEVGVLSIGRCHFKIDKQELQQLILSKLKAGELYVIKKDEHGNYVSCTNVLIDMKSWAGKWNIPKCLTPSNQH